MNYKSFLSNRLKKFNPTVRLSESGLHNTRVIVQYITLSVCENEILWSNSFYVVDICAELLPKQKERTLLCNKTFISDKPNR